MSLANYCLRCGHALEVRPAAGALRPVCPQCGRVHFFDPKVAVGVIVERAGRLLLIQRRGEPEMGKWSIPAGFVDAGEDPARAAEREGWEETGLKLQVTALVEVYGRQSPTEGADIFIIYRAAVVGGALAPGDDAAAAEYFGPEHLPELAFASTRRVVARWQAHGGPDSDSV
ncbi:MAG: NUDIX hydrolase [Anaerolineales bacterium]|nr:NUDIX hydrolase [Anaerolineales bacterium]